MNEQSINCSWKTEYERFVKGKNKTVQRRCPEMVVLKNGLGGYLTGTCPRGHLNGKKINESKK